jgi:hypothetical protein
METARRHVRCQRRRLLSGGPAPDCQGSFGTTSRQALNHALNDHWDGSTVLRVLPQLGELRKLAERHGPRRVPLRLLLRGVHGVRMLSIFTIPEALSWLHKKTGREWIDSEIFNSVCRLHLTLRAAPPSDATTEIRVFKSGAGLIVKDFGEGLLAADMGWRMAVLHPADVELIWQTGETETIHAIDGSGPQGEAERLLNPAGESASGVTGHWFFTKPVRVTRDMVRATDWVLNRIAAFDVQSNVLTAEIATKATPGRGQQRDKVAGIGGDSAKQPQCNAGPCANEAPRFSMPKRVLIGRHRHHWPDIESDIKAASTNGLAKAKAAARDWHEELALQWASANGKLTDEAPQPNGINDVMRVFGATLPSKMHKLEG